MSSPYAGAPALLRPARRAGPRGRAALQPSLDAMAAMLPAAEVPFYVVGHEPGRAVEAARRLGLGRECLLSVSLLAGEHSHYLVVGSAARLLDLEAASRALGDAVSLAGPDAVREVLGDVEPRALSPLSRAPGVGHVMDRHVPALPRAVCPAGTADRSMVVDPAVLIELLRPAIVDVSVAPPTG